MISVEDLYVAFGGFELFKQVNFIVNPRDRIGLAGRNGAGKTTLLKIFAGTPASDSGPCCCPQRYKDWISSAADGNDRFTHIDGRG